MTDGLKTTDGELMQLENLTLKLAVIQSTAEKQAAPIVAAREALGLAIGKRLGIDISTHTINLDTGEITPKPEPAEVTP